MSDESPKPMKNLAMAYAVRRRNKMSKGGVAAHCPKCMEMSGKCMAHGGMVDNEGYQHEIEPHAADESLASTRMSQNLAPEAQGHSGSPTEDAAVRAGARKSMVDELMEKRKPMAKGGYVDSSEDDLAPIHDYSYSPDGHDASTTGEAHDSDMPDEAQDESLVGQIMKKRKLKPAR